MKAIVTPALALIWAGVSLGGSLVAAPAKFQAPSLVLTTALEVGRAQFLWIGITESVLCAGLIISLVLTPTVQWQWMAVSILLFAVQRLAIMPVLDARTIEVINGALAGETHLHLVFIILEILKFLTLIIAATLILRTMEIMT